MPRSSLGRSSQSSFSLFPAIDETRSGARFVGFYRRYRPLCVGSAVFFLLPLLLLACDSATNGGTGDAAQPPVRQVETVLTIGGSEGGEIGDELIRSFSGFRRGEQLFVANGGGPEVRIYRSDGTLVNRIGRGGSGPGEFQQIRWIAPLEPDSLMVLDARARRLSFFHTDGTFGRMMPLEAPELGEPMWVGDVQGVIAIGWTLPPDPRSMQEDVAAAESLVLRFLPRPGATTTRPPSTPPPALSGLFWIRVPDPTAFRIQAVEDGARAYLASNGRELIAVSSESPEVLRWDGPDWRPAGPENLLQAEIPAPSAQGVPARSLAGLAVGPDGDAWIALAEKTSWARVNADGSVVETVDLPRGFVVWQVERDWLLGHRMDDRGFEYVEQVEFR